MLLAVMQQLSLSSVGYLPACGSCGGLLLYHLRAITIQTEILTWLIFLYIFESWCG